MCASRGEKLTLLVEFPDDGVQVGVLESHVTTSDRHRGLLGHIKPAGVLGEEAALLPLLLPLRSAGGGQLMERSSGCQEAGGCARW